MYIYPSAAPSPAMCGERMRRTACPSSRPRAQDVKFRRSRRAPSPTGAAGFNFLPFLACAARPFQIYYVCTLNLCSILSTDVLYCKPATQTRFAGDRVAQFPAAPSTLGPPGRNKRQNGRDNHVYHVFGSGHFFADVCIDAHPAKIPPSHRDRKSVV